MRIGLASYRSINNNINFNLSQIEKAIKESVGKVDLLCFGEAFIQGFDSLSWQYELDKKVAIDQSSQTIQKLLKWSTLYHIALITGYIEKEDDKIYSSCIAISNGEIICNYRRISKGWKEYTITDDHYLEGTDVKTFTLNGKMISIGLCGDIWDYLDKFKTNNLFIWPVYVNYSLEEWNDGALSEYANQAKLISKDVLMINSIDDNPVNHGGAFHFRDGKVVEKIPFDKEDILIVNI